LTSSGIPARPGTKRGPGDQRRGALRRDPGARLPWRPDHPQGVPAPLPRAGTETQALAAFLLCHERAFQHVGGVPEEILYDRAQTVWLRDDARGNPVFHPGLLDFARYYGYQPRLCPPPPSAASAIRAMDFLNSPQAIARLCAHHRCR
jgi:hypothetical protein